MRTEVRSHGFFVVKHARRLCSLLKCCTAVQCHAGRDWWRAAIPLSPLMSFLSSRLFSLQVPAPPKVFLSMVYKFEGSTGVQVALEVTTGDASSCHVGGMLVLNGEKPGDFMEGKSEGPGSGWSYCGHGCCGLG